MFAGLSWFLDLIRVMKIEIVDVQLLYDQQPPSSPRAREGHEGGAPSELVSCRIRLIGARELPCGPDSQPNELAGVQAPT